MIEYFGNGVKKKFITLYNPWGKGNIENEFFNFNKIKEETKNFEYITNYNNEYSNTGLIKIPLNLFGIWFKYLEICCPKYGFHYKVFNNYLKENISHIYCFSNNIKQDIEIELFLDELENIRRIKNQNINVDLILSEITRNYCFNTIEKSTQKESKFYVRKNAYIYKKLLDVGNYLITISLYYEKNNYKYNLRIGGEKEYVNGISFDNYIKLSNYYINYNRQLINANDNAIISKYILLEKTYYDLKIYKIAKEIYKLIYNPYENDIEIKVQNGLKKIISIITDAYNNNLYEFQKNYENDNITINYFFKNVKEKLRSDPYNLITHNESKIIELVEILKSQANNVKVILQKYNNTTEKITLLQLKDKITGSEIKKHKFYSSIRGYLITQYGIEDCNIYQKFENTIFFKKFVLKEIPSISNENNIKNLNFYINEQIDKNDLIDKAYCDILFIVDATGSMQPFIETSIKNCVDIIEKINLKFSSLKMFKYGAIFYRDPIDNYKDEHSFFQMCTDKNKFQNLIRNVKANGGGDESEDWNGAYTIALNQINWTSLKSNKIIVHIADAGAYGNEFSNSNDRHYEEGPKFIKTIKKIAEKGFKIIAFPIGTIPIKSFNKFKEIYIAHNGYSFSIFNNLMNINNFSNITEEAINFIIAHS